MSLEGKSGQEPEKKRGKVAKIMTPEVYADKLKLFEIPQSIIEMINDGKAYIEEISSEKKKGPKSIRILDNQHKEIFFKDIESNINE